MVRTALVLVVGSLLVLVTSALDYRSPPVSLTCRDRVKQEEERPRADAFVPTCDRYGNYEPVQCRKGHWRDKGRCLCVDQLTGRPFADINGLEFRFWSSERHMTCRCALDHELEADRATHCDQSTGDYRPVLCIGERCRCAERWGAPMYDFGEFNKGDSNCLCARRSSDLGRQVGLSINCNQYGQFDPIQCTGSSCFCVDQDGTQIGEHVSRGEADKLKC